MDLNETTRLCKAIATIKPAQAFDEETPAFWSMILADVRYEDARQAVINLGGKTRFIDPADILAEVKAIRRERLEHADRILPDADPDDVQAWLAARRRGIQALADGEAKPPAPRPAVPVEPRLAAALPSVFHRVPRPPAITADGGPRPAKAAPSPTVPDRAAADMEAERRRQLDALAQLVASETAAAEMPTS